MLSQVLLFALFSSTGAALRFFAEKFFVQGFASKSFIPVLVINIVGSLLIGLFSQLSFFTTPENRLLYLVAFLGSFTTFSSYSLQALSLFESKNYVEAVAVFVGTPVLGLLACFVGIRLAKII